MSDLLIRSLSMGVLVVIVYYTFSFLNGYFTDYKANDLFALGLGVGNILVTYVGGKTGLL